MKFIRFFIALLFFFVCPPAVAAERIDLAAFGQIPMMHEGRLKPLDTVARVKLRHISGRESVEGLNATAWLAELLFDPARAAQRPVFAVRNPAVLRQMNLGRGRDALYSYHEIAPGLSVTEHLVPPLLQADDKTLTEDQEDFLALHDAGLVFGQMMGALSMILPLDIEDQGWPSEVGAARTYMEILPFEQSMRAQMTEIVRRRGNMPESYTAEEKARGMVLMKMDLLRAAAHNNVFFRVMPSPWSGEEWLSPWEVISTGQGSPRTATLLTSWEDLSESWRSGDEESSRKAIQKLTADLPGVSAARMGLEYAYHVFRPFRLAEILYGLSLILMAPVIFGRRGMGATILLAVAGTGAALHVAGILSRIIILQRPPVGTLYESVLFVTLIMVVLALVIEAQRRDGYALAAGVGSALALMMAAPVFAPAGDPLEVLVAVLNTNFWLATHVVVITAGYGAALLAAVMAHLALGLCGKRDFSAIIHRLLLVALLLTGVGTVLGGIWADQSWGRFWGWDPKENGALLIVMWSAWLLHGRWGGHLRGDLYNAMVCVLAVIVSLSWFGVNLLNVGLHSYGFTSGMAAGLAAYCTVEALLIVFLCHYSRSRRISS